MYNKKYVAIVEAKELVYEEVNKKDYWCPDDAAAMIKEALSNKSLPILKKMAIITVLISGTCLEAGGFNMPATACCLENFNFVKKEVSKKRNIKLYVWDEILRRYYNFKVF